MTKDMKIICTLATIVFAVSMLFSCRTTETIPELHLRDTTKMVYQHDSVITKMRTVYVSVPVPVVKLSTTTLDTLSVLNSGLYRSIAKIKNGILTHRLETIPGAKLNTSIQANDTKEIHNRGEEYTKSETVLKPYPVYKNKYIYKNKKLTKWESFKMNVGGIAIEILALITIYFIFRLCSKYKILSLLKKAITHI